MKIEAALKKLKSGSKIRRISWPAEVYLTLYHDGQTLMESDGVDQQHPYKIKMDALCAEDWEEVEETAYIECDHDNAYKYVVKFLQDAGALLWCCRFMCATKMPIYQIKERIRIAGYSTMTEDTLGSLTRLPFDVKVMIEEQKKRDSLSSGAK